LPPPLTKTSKLAKKPNKYWWMELECRKIPVVRVILEAKIRVKPANELGSSSLINRYPGSV
jgi:hypothetical protein